MVFVAIHRNDMGMALVHVGIIKDVHEYDVEAHADEHIVEHVGVGCFFPCRILLTTELFIANSFCEDDDELFLT